MKRKKTVSMLLALLTLVCLLAGCGSESPADNLPPVKKSASTSSPSPSPSPSPAPSPSPTDDAPPANEETPVEEEAEEGRTEKAADTEEPESSAEETTLIINADDGDEAPPVFTEGQEPPRYKVMVSDLSWSKARAACWDLGGYLAVITSREELDEIASLAEDQGLTYVWIGCHREDRKLVWETDENVDYFNWGSGEPSEQDYYDYAREDFIMLRREGDRWYYNDSRDDPAGVFPEFYSGVMGYVCEFDR